jgi:hypothetical protein
MNLKNSLIGLMLMAVSAGAMAEWTKTGGTDGFDNYADLSTIQKSGSTAKMWVLQDFKKTQTLYVGKSYLSIMFRYEYDCNEKKSRLLLLQQILKLLVVQSNYLYLYSIIFPFLSK